MYNSSGETLYTRVDGSNSCYSIGVLELIIGNGPSVVEGLVYEVCDADNDGLVAFELDTQIDTILNGQTNVDVTFYEFEADAESSINPLPSTYNSCLLYTSPSPRDRGWARMPSSA